MVEYGVARNGKVFIFTNSSFILTACYRAVRLGLSGRQWYGDNLIKMTKDTKRILMAEVIVMLLGVGMYLFLTFR